MNVFASSNFNKSYILKQQCLSVWAVPRRIFQSLPVPCGMFWGVGEGRARWSTGRGGGHQGGGRVGKDRVGGGQHGRGRTDGCIMHQVHTRGGVAWNGVAMGYPLVYYECHFECFKITMPFFLIAIIYVRNQKEYID
jgi:hypothetical protein